jgi:hypothetical protein
VPKDRRVGDFPIGAGPIPSGTFIAEGNEQKAGGARRGAA